MPQKRATPDYSTEEWHLAFLEPLPNEKPLMIDGYKFTQVFREMTSLNLKGSKDQLVLDFQKWLTEKTGMTEKFNIKNIVYLSNWLNMRYIYVSDIPEIVAANVEPVYKRVAAKKSTKRRRNIRK